MMICTHGTTATTRSGRVYNRSTTCDCSTPTRPCTKCSRILRSGRVVSRICLCHHQVSPPGPAAATTGQTGTTKTPPCGTGRAPSSATSLAFCSCVKRHRIRKDQYHCLSCGDRVPERLHGDIPLVKPGGDPEPHLRTQVHVQGIGNHRTHYLDILLDSGNCAGRDVLSHSKALELLGSLDHGVLNKGGPRHTIGQDANNNCFHCSGHLTLVLDVGEKLQKPVKFCVVKDSTYDAGLCMKTLANMNAVLDFSGKVSYLRRARPSLNTLLLQKVSPYLNIGDHEPVRIKKGLIDTGCTHTIIPYWVVKHLDLDITWGTELVEYHTNMVEEEYGYITQDISITMASKKYNLPKYTTIQDTNTDILLLGVDFCSLNKIKIYLNKNFWGSGIR